MPSTSRRLPISDGVQTPPPKSLLALVTTYTVVTFPCAPVLTNLRVFPHTITMLIAALPHCLCLQQDEFVITAWWPPKMTQMAAYAAAHFNLVATGNIVSFSCQYDPTKPNNISKNFTTTDAFDCIASNLPEIAANGLKAAFSTGHYVRDSHSWAFGEAAGFGGVTPVQATGYASM